MLPKFTCVRDWKRYIKQQVAEMEKQHHLLGRRIIMVHGLLMEMPEEEQNFNYKRDDTSVGSDWSITGGFMPHPKPEPEESTHKRSADNKKDPPPTTSSSFQPAITPIKQESRSSSNCEECVKFPDETSTIGLHEPTPQSRSEKKSTGVDTRCVGSSNATAQFTQNCDECVKFSDETSAIGLHEPTPQSRSEKKSTGVDTRCVGSSNATAQFTQSKRGGVIALCEGAIYYKNDKDNVHRDHAKVKAIVGMFGNCHETFAKYKCRNGTSTNPAITCRAHFYAPADMEDGNQSPIRLVGKHEHELYTTNYFDLLSNLL